MIRLMEKMPETLFFMGLKNGFSGIVGGAGFFLSTVLQACEQSYFFWVFCEQAVF